MVEIPSVVSFTETDCLVGDAALAQLLVDPKNTIFDIKRIIGRRFDDPVLQKHKNSVLYKIADVDGKPKICISIKIKERMFDPEEISAIILRRLVENAEVFLGHKITDAVIAVPAFFTDSQRQATKDAGTIAGLNVLQILNEPAASAMAYGLHKSSKEKNVLICDFGRGKFDASILTIKQGKIFEVQATAGHLSLSVLDIDKALTDYCVSLILEKFGIDIREDTQAMRQLRLTCSGARLLLSSQPKAVVEIERLEEINYLVISRSEFEQFCEPVFDRTLDLLAEVFAESGLGRKDIDDVVLNGGCSVIPKIRNLVSNFFHGKQIKRGANPEEAVAYGAAIQAAVLFGYRDWDIGDMPCIDVNPLSVGVESSGGIFSIVIPRNTPIPHRVSYTFTTQTDNQRNAVIRLYEGERAFVVDNHLLGTLVLDDLQLLPKGIPKIDVIFEIDKNGTLKVSATETNRVDSGRVSLTLDKSRLSSEDISRRLQEAKEFKQCDAEKKTRIRFMDSLESYVHTISKAFLSHSKDRLRDRDKLEVKKICHEICDWLQTNCSVDRNTLVEKKEYAEKLLQPYALHLGLSVPGSDFVLLPVATEDDY